MTGINSVVVSDNGLGDTSATVGQVNYANGSFFGWNVLVSSGVTKPVLGTGLLALGLCAARRKPARA